jgi:hypothetical protein
MSQSEQQPANHLASRLVEILASRFRP